MTIAAVPPDVIADAVAAAKAYMRRGDTDDEDALTADLAASAILLAEGFCGQALVQRAASEMVSAAGGWHQLSAMPVASIAPIAGMAVGDYAIDIDASGTGWVRMSGAAASVDYVVGTATGWAALPSPVAQGIVMLIAHLFAHREGDAVPPAAVAALWRPYRRMRLDREQRR